MSEQMELDEAIKYLDWYFECDDGGADKDACKAWKFVKTNIYKPLPVQNIRHIIAGDRRIDVVRCKDCKHSTIINDALYCDRTDEFWMRLRKQDWFCADGERKDD